jgi:hypothetical protein
MVMSKVAQLNKRLFTGKKFFLENVPFSPGEFGTFYLCCLKAPNRFWVKSKVDQGDKTRLSGKKFFLENVPFSPGGFGTFCLCFLKALNRFWVKSKVDQGDKTRLSGKKFFSKMCHSRLASLARFMLGPISCVKLLYNQLFFYCTIIGIVRSLLVLWGRIEK